VQIYLVWAVWQKVGAWDGIGYYGIVVFEEAKYLLSGCKKTEKLPQYLLPNTIIPNKVLDLLKNLVKRCLSHNSCCTPL
jgi:hypothetical protein